MGFQSVVRLDATDGIVGEVAFGGPFYAEPKILNSTSAANNVIGRAFQQVSSVDDDVTADAGAAGVFAGILAFPKEHSTAGTSAGALEPTLTLLNEEVASLVKEARGMIVALPAAANIGDVVYYNFSTGVLSTTAPGATVPTGTTRVPNGVVVRNNIPGAGLAYIDFSA